MKTNKIVLLILSALIIVTGCKKFETSFNKELINGTWILNSIEDSNINTKESVVMVISEGRITIFHRQEIDTNNSIWKTSPIYEYIFDGKYLNIKSSYDNSGEIINNTFIVETIQSNELSFKYEGKKYTFYRPESQYTTSIIGTWQSLQYTPAELNDMPIKIEYKINGTYDFYSKSDNQWIKTNEKCKYYLYGNLIVFCYKINDNSVCDIWKISIEEDTLNLSNFENSEEKKVKFQNIETLSKHTILFYFQSLDNLYTLLWNNIYEIAIVPRYKDGNNILVFVDSQEGQTPSTCTQKNQLFLINGDGTMTSIKDFAVKFDHKVKDPSLPSTLGEIMQYCIDHFPADKYSLLMSSHGTGWLPYYSPYSQSIGSNTYTKHEMNINEVAAAIPVKLEFLAFDACYMNDIECVYEFNDKAEYIIGSILKVPGFGFDYEITLPYFLNGYYSTLCSKLIEKYLNISSASLTVTKTSALNDYAAHIKHLFETKKCEIEKYDTSLFRYSMYDDGFFFVGMKDFFSNYFGFNNEEYITNEISKILISKQVYFNNYSEENNWYNAHCGYSIWLPNRYNEETAKKYLESMKQYKWYKDSGADIYLNQLMNLPMK